MFFPLKLCKPIAKGPASKRAFISDMKKMSNPVITVPFGVLTGKMGNGVTNAVIQPSRILTVSAIWGKMSTKTILDMKKMSSPVITVPFGVLTGKIGNGVTNAVIQPSGILTVPTIRGKMSTTTKLRRC